jgi:hypothetical protein
MRVYSLWLIALISVSELVYAKQTKEVLPDGEIEAFISEGELSRIKVMDDRIKSVRSSLGELELLEDTKVGDIYIRPARPGKAPINMFVTTEKSHTYKLLLIPKKMPSEQIFIKCESAPDSYKSESSMKEMVVHLMQDMQSGRESRGFTRLESTEILDIEGDQYNKTVIYTSASIIGEVLEFHNKSTEHFRITPEIFTPLKNIELIAISIDKGELAPSEKTQIYLVKRG